MKKDSIVTILLVFNILMVSYTTLIKRQGATYDFTTFGFDNQQLDGQRILSGWSNMCSKE